MKDATQMFTGKSEKMILVCDRMNMNMLHELWSSQKENILIINKWNSTKHNYDVQPESHSVLLFMVYDFHRSRVCLIRCIC